MTSIEGAVLCNSGDFDGLPSKEAITAITNKLKESGAGNAQTSYKLRDWNFSRQVC